MSTMTRRAVFASIALASILGAARPAVAFELSVEEERGVQVASMATAYAFGALHTALIGHALVKGKPLSRVWLPGTIMSAISIAGLGTGYFTLGIIADDADRRAAYGVAAAAGLMLGGLHLAMAIDGGIRDKESSFWMTPVPASITLVHGLALSAFGIVLIAGANPGMSDVSKLVPLYTWAGTGAILAGYSVLSLILGRKDRKKVRPAPATMPAHPM